MSKDLTDYWEFSVSHVRHATSGYDYGFQHYRTIRDSVNNLPENSRRYSDKQVHHILDFLTRKDAGIIASNSNNYGRVYYARSGS